MQATVPDAGSARFGPPTQTIQPMSRPAHEAIDRPAGHEPALARRAFRPVERPRGWVSRTTALPLACAGCIALATAYIVIDDPGDGDGGLMACPIRALTGRWCPGCGLTRATHHLLRGDVVRALSFNALVVPILIALVALMLLWLRVESGRGAPRWVHGIRPAAALYSGVAAGVAVAAFTVVRNLDGWSMLRGG